MKEFTNLKSQVVPLNIKDIDTDMLIPAQYLTSISKSGYGQNLFRRLRDEQADFPLNQEHYRQAKILIADSNFGCGSSREHAVWALMDWGIEVVICKSFADIFSSNSGKNGLLLITLPEQVVDQLLSQAQHSSLELEIDLEAQEVRQGAEVYKFEYPAFRKHCLLYGLDDLDYIRSEQTAIDAYLKENSDKFFVQKHEC
jgi:3-isopropylmalate/(R)-2-methylmalate dehydratase small subunit